MSGFGTQAFVHLKSTIDDSESFVFGFKLLLRQGINAADESINKDCFRTEFRFGYPRADESLSAEDLSDWMNGVDLWKSKFRKDLVSYTAEVITEDFFGRSLFSIDIIPDSSLQERQNLLISKAKEDPIGYLRSTLFALFRPSIREQQLRMKWIPIIQSGSCRTTRYIGHFLLNLRLLPWFITFIVDFPLQKAFELCFRMTPSSEWLLSYISIIYLLLSVLSPKRLFEKYIPQNWRNSLSKVSAKLIVLYIYCKLIPDVILSGAFSIGR